MSRVRFLFHVAILAVLSGCVAPAEYQRPELPAGIGWQGQPTKNSDRQDAPATSTWWTAFADGGLDKVVPVVLAANHDIFAASLRARRALLEAGIAAEAEKPRLGGDVSLNRTAHLSGDRPSSGRSQSGLSLSYDMDLWGRLAAQRDIATLEATASADDIEAARLTVIAATVSTWWRLAYANQMLESAAQGLAVSRRTQGIVATMRSAQTASELETLEITQAIESQLAALEALKRERDIQRVTLAVLLNGAPNPAGEPLRLAQRAMPPLEPGLPANLIARRPDLRAAETRLRATLRQTDEVSASFYPPISLNGNLGAGGVELAQLLANPVATLGAGAVLPFLNAQDMDLKIRVSAVKYEEAVVAFRSTMLTALSEVANGLSARQSLAREGSHLQRALDAQRRVETLYETRLRSGDIGLRPLLEVQERTRQAENALIGNRLSRLLNEAMLYRALGGYR